MTAHRTMTGDERAAAAADLFAEAAAGQTVELAVLSGLERCSLGGPAQALFETVIADAWLKLGGRHRAQALDLATAGLIERGLLIDDKPEGPNLPAYSMAPELGLAMAARSRPTYIVTTEVVGRPVRCLQFFAVGDVEVPVRGVVVEEPIGLPPGTGAHPNLKKMGPLGWFTRYRLVSQETAAGILADVAIVGRPGDTGPLPYAVSRFKHREGQAVTEAGMVVVGDGTTARVRWLRAGADSGTVSVFDPSEERDVETPAPTSPYSGESADQDVAILDVDGLRAAARRLLESGSW
jgi:hypothetical protein